jgi:hypothetical protein
VFGQFLRRRPTPAHRRALPPPWARRWRALLRRPVARWLLAATPVAALLMILTVLTPVAPSGAELAVTWELAGRIGVVVVTALIGRAMLNHGR